MSKALAFSEVTTEAFTRNHLVISLHHALALEVRGTQGHFLWSIARELCSVARRA